MHSCFKSDNRDTGRSTCLGPGQGNIKYCSYASPHDLAFDDLVRLDELLYTRFRRA